MTQHTECLGAVEYAKLVNNTVTAFGPTAYPEVATNPDEPEAIVIIKCIWEELGLCKHTPIIIADSTRTPVRLKDIPLVPCNPNLIKGSVTTNPKP